MISLRGLTARAGNALILDDVSFSVSAGEIVTLFGPSGAGKTTIARAIAGIDMPGIEVSGEVRQDGRLGYLPQNAPTTLNPARRIGKALGELVDLHQSGPVARILDMAAFYCPKRTLRKYPHQFSGGERTRLALAQVLATNPTVLVLDEPTAGLDSLSRSKLLDQLESLRSNGTTIVLITHDPYVVERLSDRTLYVHRGRVVAETDRPSITPPPPRRSSTLPADRVVELRDVSVTRPPILHGIDLDLHAGETLGLIGVSGAGKSTLARCIAGLIALSSGSIHVDGEPFPLLRKRSRRQLACVQYLWQESASSFEPRRRVVDQVAATAVRLRGRGVTEARTEALTLLDSMDLDEATAFRYPAGLSGGQLQRAALARALLAHPRVLICDEPTTGLDRPLSTIVLDQIDSYRRDTGASVLSISHDLRSQLERADRIAIVDNGRITEIAAPADLLTAPQTPVLHALLAAESIESSHT